MLITHLLFADEMLFCGDSTNQMVHLKWILFLFEALSGLWINLEKTGIIPIGGVNNSVLLAQELGCNVSQLPTTYLGLPLSAKQKAKVVWNAVEEKFCTRWLYGKDSIYCSTYLQQPLNHACIFDVTFKNSEGG